ncbi:MAG TPA: adenylate/guanylate cyclase domain-containing protein [Candidatus Angelobacter sp.]
MSRLDPSSQIEEPLSHSPEAKGFAITTYQKQVLLVVDDDYDNREIVRRFLAFQGPDIILASNGHEALAIISSRRVDIVLLDLMMPDIDGLGVLQKLKATFQFGELPVLMISSVDEIDKVAACIEAGAIDYILKPVNAILLRAKVRSLLERKQFRDQERRRTQQLEKTLCELEVQKRKTEELLLNVLPQKIADELQVSGCVSPMYFEDATIVFTDFVNFTAATEKMAADELVTELNYYFTKFDEVVDRYGLEKLKTVGDSYIFLSGVPERSPSHPVDAVLAAMEMLECVKQRQGHPLSGWAMRVGINTGAVIAGVVGTRKFAFDVWGDSVNFASRMVSSGSPNRINISARTFHRVKDFFFCAPRGEVKIKGNRWVEMYFVEGPLPALSADALEFPAAPFRERYKRYFQRELEVFDGTKTGIREP